MIILSEINATDSKDPFVLKGVVALLRDRSKSKSGVLCKASVMLPFSNFNFSNASVN